MKQNLLTLILISATFISCGQTLPEKVSETDFTIGKSIKIESSVLSETRDLNIYLPASYTEDSSKNYPVIYLLDGSKDEDFIHISGIVQFGSFSWINMVPESIVVGIGNVDRKRDFTYPSESELDKKEFPISGKSEKFINFLIKELQPFVESNYRTTETKTIIGQSLGGLLATEVLINKPNTFDNYIIVSPSLWWDSEKLLDKEMMSYDSKKSIYVAGGKEGEVMERTAKELYAKLEKSKSANTTLFYEFLEDKTHGDALHNAVYNAFEKFYKPTDAQMMLNEIENSQLPEEAKGKIKTVIKLRQLISENKCSDALSLFSKEQQKDIKKIQKNEIMFSQWCDAWKMKDEEFKEYVDDIISGKGSFVFEDNEWKIDEK